MDPARRAAFDVLRAVRVDDAYANLALASALAAHGLGGRDAAFATELAAGTLRGLGTYDAVLAACVDRPIAKVEARVLDCLRLGCHQLLGMRVPAHAAISTTVDLVRDRSGAGAAGFANAVLRRVSAADLTTWVSRVAPDAATDPIGHLAVAHSHPRWVVAALSAALSAPGSAQGSVASSSPAGAGDPAAALPDTGAPPAEPASDLPALLAADNEPPRVVLVARPGRSSVEELPGEPTRLSPYGVALAGGDPASVPAVAEGRAGVQDEGSQLVAIALASAALPDAAPAGPSLGERWLDLCAGPGGKAALLAALASGAGARLVAAELQPHRAGLVARNLVGASGVLGVVVADGTRPPWPEGAFDRVLVDAPCTGLGALRRRPEARWRRTPADVSALAPLQRSLLSSALDSVRPGGLVLYATCSPVLEETRDVVTAVLSERPEVSLVPLRDVAPDAAGPLPGTVQLWPHRHGTDAMFLALLTR